MRKRKPGYILLALLVITGLAGTYHSSLSNKERKTAISYLKETKNLFLNSVEGLSNVQLDFKPMPERWSIRQCVEHIAIAEKNISDIAIKNLQQPSDPAKRNQVIIKDEEVIQIITDRSQKVMAAEFLQPITSSIKTTGSDIDEFKMLREKNINFLKTTTADLRNHFSQYPVFGMLDDYQFLLLMAAHTRRYTLQIEEIKSSPDFPE
jgi:DinB superfamily